MTKRQRFVVNASASMTKRRSFVIVPNGSMRNRPLFFIEGGKNGGRRNFHPFATSDFLLILGLYHLQRVKNLFNNRS
jgi:hypothetical protein